jgi:methylmalonyl-CoA mutase N-terminal domain/subunit
MAAVLGGAQSIHLCSYDEGHGLPTEESSRMALRTQQIVAYETGVTKTIDPLGGSYYVESLTNQMEAAIEAKIAEADARGGMAAAIQEGWLEEEINKARLHNQEMLDSGERAQVGVNRFKIDPEDETPVEIHKLKADEWGERRSEYLRKYRQKRDAQKWAEAMEQIDTAWKAGANMVPVFMNALENKVTMGECHEGMRQAQKWSFR